MPGSFLRLCLIGAGVACLALGLYPRTSGHSAASLDAGSGGSQQSSAHEFTLGLPSSPVYRATTVQSETTDTVVERQIVTRHDESSQTRIEFLSWSMALVVAGVVLLAVSLRRQGRGTTTPA